MLRERRGIIGLAIGQARDAGVGAGAGQEFGQYVDLARERGADRPRENRRGALAITRKADFRAAPGDRRAERLDRKSVVSGKSVTVRVDLGGHGIHKKQTKTQKSI